MGPIHLDRKWHIVQDTDFTENLREALDEPDLVTWWNKRVQRYCIGIWRNEDRGLVQELPLVVYHPSRISRYSVEVLKFVCSPWNTRQLKEAARELAQQDRRRDWAFMDESHEKDALLKSFRRTNQRKFGDVRAARIDRFYRHYFGINPEKE